MISKSAVLQRERDERSLRWLGKNSGAREGSLKLNLAVPASLRRIVPTVREVDHDLAHQNQRVDLEITIGTNLASKPSVPGALTSAVKEL